MRVPIVLLMLALASPHARADAPATMSASAPTTMPASLFDPARHMRVGEVRAGMKGYGLTVLSGTTIERFDVEVISLLHNAFGPQQSVVMIRCLGDAMQHLGPISGASGSPIYLFDDDGTARLIGAYAFGFDNAKDPIIGVQPIEYMMTLRKPPPGVDDTGTKPLAASPRSWSLLESQPWLASRRAAPESPEPRAAAPPANRFRPLSVPLAVRGASAATFAALGSTFRGGGFEPMLAVGAASAPTAVPTPLEPGSVMGAAVLTGDLELTALGTCTEVIDGRAFGFGHPFNGEGATSIPMGAGSVSLVMPTSTSSFKLGGLNGVSGAIDLDGTYGVAGQIGARATTVPIAVEVRQRETGEARTFNYRAALHRTFTPQMVAAALQASTVADQQLPVEHTARYRVTMNFADGRTIEIRNVATSLGGVDLGRDAAWPIATLMNNPFGNVAIASVSASVEIERGVNEATIEAAAPARPAYRPGEVARVNVRLRQHKGEAFAHAIGVALPDTLKDGDYALSVSDAVTAMTAEAIARPDRFATRDVDELFATLAEVGASLRNDALHVRLAGVGAGLAIGRTALDGLPPSRRSILQAAARPDTAEREAGLVSVVPMDRVVSGEASATIRVRKKLP